MHKAHEAGFGSAEFSGKKQTEKVLLRHLLDHVRGEFACFVQLHCDRVQIFLGEIPSVLADQFLFFGKYECSLLACFLCCCHSLPERAPARHAEITKR